MRQYIRENLPVILAVTTALSLLTAIVLVIGGLASYGLSSTQGTVAVAALMVALVSGIALYCLWSDEQRRIASDAG